MDLFTKKCPSCNKVLRRLEPCSSCLEKQRAKAIEEAWARTSKRILEGSSATAVRLLDDLQPEHRAALIESLRAFAEGVKVEGFAERDYFAAWEEAGDHD